MSYTASHLSKQCHSMASDRKAVNWLLFLHCAFPLSPNSNSHLILHMLLLWMEPSPDTHCRSDYQLSTSGCSKLEKGWKNSSEGLISKGTKTTQNKGKENEFILVTCFGSWKLILIMPNASWSAVSEPAETGQCWSNEDIVTWDDTAVHTTERVLSSELDPSLLMQTTSYFG